MIARNYIQWPEALRFQCEMFSNGYKNSPRIMRLMGVIFSQVPDVPQWVKDAQARARALLKLWKKAQVELGFKQAAAPKNMIAGFYYGPMGETWSGRGLMPKWLSVLVRNGTSKEAFLYQPKD